MAYDDELAVRVRLLLIRQQGFDEKQMFGGLCFLLHGNMVCGILGDHLIVRVGPGQYAAALERPHTSLFDFTGRPMTDWVMVSPQGLRKEQDLAAWVQQGMGYALSLPPKGTD